MKFLITKNSFHSPVTLKKLLYIFTLGYIIISVDLEFSVFFIVPSFFVIFFCRKKKLQNDIFYYSRTVCNNCKCPREAHDVCHEEFVNVCDRIGFQPSPEPARHPISKEKTLSEGYSWVPPGLSSHKVIFYYSDLLYAKKVLFNVKKC